VRGHQDQHRLERHENRLASYRHHP
jgi:hypothetical protein